MVKLAVHEKEKLNGVKFDEEATFDEFFKSLVDHLLSKFLRSMNTANVFPTERIRLSRVARAPSKVLTSRPTKRRVRTVWVPTRTSIP